VLVRLLVRSACLAALAACAQAAEYAQSVVKISVTGQRPDFALPWQDAAFNKSSGSGFVIQEGKKRWILTNAHVISDARFIEVEREGDPRPRPARVVFAGHDCDLAVLDVDDPGFWAETQPLKLGAALPRLDEQVIVVGYPMGGDRLSLTRGVVSRIDYSVYAHSDVDAHLVLQVDAAINPGNSGGPVLFNDRIAGVAFQGIQSAQNIGYAIPISVIRHFLDDIADGRYDGYPELGVDHLETRNPALRRQLKLPADKSGVTLSRIDPLGSAAGHLLPGDVLLTIDGVPIDDDGSIHYKGVAMEYVELLERKQAGELLRFDIWRNGALQPLSFPLRPPSGAFLFRQNYDVRPRYVITGGLVFAPLTRELLNGLSKQFGKPDTHPLLYDWTYGRADALVREQDERVILLRRLPHPINAYADAFLYGEVADVNGKPLRGLADLAAALREPVNGFHVFRFRNRKDELVLDAAEAARTEAALLAAYGVPSPAYTGPDK
jgi:S1-C subfamily serine protease